MVTAAVVAPAIVTSVLDFGFAGAVSPLLRHLMASPVQESQVFVPTLVLSVLALEAFEAVRPALKASVIIQE